MVPPILFEEGGGTVPPPIGERSSLRLQPEGGFQQGVVFHREGDRDFAIGFFDGGGFDQTTNGFLHRVALGGFAQVFGSGFGLATSGGFVQSRRQVSDDFGVITTSGFHGLPRKGGGNLTFGNHFLDRFGGGLQFEHLHDPHDRQTRLFSDLFFGPAEVDQTLEDLALLERGQRFAAVRDDLRHDPVGFRRIFVFGLHRDRLDFGTIDFDGAEDRQQTAVPVRDIDHTVFG